MLWSFFKFAVKFAREVVLDRCASVYGIRALGLRGRGLAQSLREVDDVYKEIEGGFGRRVMVVES